MFDVYEAEKEKLDKLVDSFAAEMKKKLHEKLKKGITGWDSREFKIQFTHRVLDNLLEKKMVNVANYAAMLWNLEEQEKKKAALSGENNAAP